MVGPTSTDVAKALSNGISSNRFVVNIGCHDGKSWDDPCYPLFESGYPGLAIDGRDYPDIHKNLPDTVSKLMNQFLTPLNTPKVLRDNGCPDQPHMIKIDIDGIDGDVLISILTAGIRPDFFQVEIQPEFPPPVVFSVKHHPLYRSKNGFGGFYGISISGIEIIARSFGYTPLFLDLKTPATHDMLCIRNDLLPQTAFAPLDTYRAYEAEGCRIFHFTQCALASQRWQRRTDYTNLLIEMFQACLYSSQALFGIVLPFELGLDWHSIAERNTAPTKPSGRS